MAVTVIAVDWTELKTFVDERNANLNYIERSKNYELVAFDGIFTMTFTLSKDPEDSTDLDDFINNYKATSNVPLGNMEFDNSRRLKVTGMSQGGSSGGPAAISKSIKLRDIVKHGLINRNERVYSSQGFRTIYARNGEGLLYGFLLTLESMEKDWLIRLIVDGEEVFTTDGVDTEDLSKSDRYGFEEADEAPLILGWSLNDKTVRFQLPSPILYESNVTLMIKRDGSSKKFRAGLVLLTEES